jgi:hypothetical protein
MDKTSSHDDGPSLLEILESALAEISEQLGDVNIPKVWTELD